MKHIDLLLPFALPHPQMAADLLREIKTPALATLISRATAPVETVFDEFSHALPHEIWLARQFGLAGRLDLAGSPSIAIAAMQAEGLQAAAGTWFLLQPVHIHIARDHLVLTDLRQLTLSEPESHALFDTAKPLFEEAGHELLYGDAGAWFVRADEWTRLKTATPDAACGHNIDIWMPKGAGERAWRKVQNEVQMHWHTHAVNAEREARGLKPVNSLWLWGGAPAEINPMTTPYSHLFKLPGWSKSLGRVAQPDGNAVDTIAAATESGLALLDNLIEPALTEDWPDWLARMQTLEADWFAPLLDGLKAGKIDRLRLILSHNTRLSEFTISRNSLRKFWIKPSLVRLAP